MMPPPDQLYSDAGETLATAGQDRGLPTLLSRATAWEPAAFLRRVFRRRDRHAKGRTLDRVEEGQE